MADLSEYLGHLLCEVTRARVMADAEAVRTATAYLGDGSNLLRHFPVPRMRLPELEITVPVIINDIPDGYTETTRADPRLLARLLADNLGPVLAREGMKIDTGEITRIILEDPLLSEGRLSAEVPELLARRLQERVRAASRSSARGAAAREPAIPAERFHAISGMLREQIARILAGLPRRPAGIAVDPRTSAVKNVGDSAMVVNIKLVIREESLEILLDDAGEGGAASPRIGRLVPE
jgi:hypothetical protein